MKARRGLKAFTLCLAAVLLIALLSAKEGLAADKRRVLAFLGRSLDAAIAPLLIAFALIVALKVIEASPDISYTTMSSSFKRGGLWTARPP